MSIHVLKIVACAENHRDYPDGERHALLVFANTDDLETALSSTPPFLATCGWQQTELRDAKKLAIEISSISDKALRSAAGTALQQGYGIVVYSDPVTHLNS